MARAPCTPWGDTGVVDNNTETALFRGGGSVSGDDSPIPVYVSFSNASDSERVSRTFMRTGSATPPQTTGLDVVVPKTA